jgi:hypothetical protein
MMPVTCSYTKVLLSQGEKKVNSRLDMYTDSCSNKVTQIPLYIHMYTKFPAYSS